MNRKAAQSDSDCLRKLYIFIWEMVDWRAVTVCGWPVAFFT